MSEKEKRYNGAMRIFQALSGVDEELLARCEDSGNVAATIKRVRPVWYYGKVVAACMCFIVLGTVIWNANRLMSDKSESARDTAAPEAEMNQMSEEMSAADMDAGDSGLSITGSGQEAKAEEDISEAGATEEMQDGASVLLDTINEPEACIKDLREIMSEEEARAVGELGEYVPTELPAGYVFEEARRTTDPDTGETLSMSFCWTKGMDSIHIHVSKVVAETIETVEVDKPELYDVRLYDIPYADTVPEENRESFNNPVFAREDFNLGIVEARMKSVADAGDTDTPRGNFAILYETGIMVEFSGRGNAESIYRMFATME